ncbi:hypothetical protein GVAV_001946 [Gurleya vavrai]
MKFSILRIIILTRLSIEITCADKIEPATPAEKPAEKSNTPWYRINIIAPLYITRYASTGLGFLFFIIQLSIITIIALLPFKFLDGFQSCLTSGVGTFFFAGHILAKPFTSYLSVLDFIFYISCYIIALAAIVVSVNEKFSNLFLSIGGGYVVSSLLTAFLGFRHYLIYLLTFIVAFVGFVLLKKSSAQLHFAFVKSLVFGYAFVVMLDLLTPVKFLKSLYLEDVMLKGIHKVIGYLVFLFATVFIFFYTYNKEKVQKFFSKK